MEKLLINHKELESLKREVEGVKSTIEILQNKAMMEDITESEMLEQKGKDLIKIEI
jgi:hypothetical protein